MKWILLLVLFANCNNKDTENYENNSGIKNKVDTYLNLSHSIRDVVNHPAFRDYGNMLLPWNDNSSYFDTSLENVGSLMPYHSNVRPEVVVSTLNYMIDEVNSGRTLFYNFYSDVQKQQDSSKEQTGLFFFKGKPGAPFAIVCPGGGFSYVGSLHEGFPLAQEISQKGLNVFVIRYRTGSQQKATEDLAAAVSFIIQNAANLGIATKGYSLWGGSAGARMVGNIAYSGVSAYGGDNLPKPAAVIIAYTGQSTYSADFPPVFITVAENDRIVNVSAVDKRVDKLREEGVEVEYRKYKTSGHGFGTGKGTDAEGWMNDAVEFWEKQAGF